MGIKLSWTGLALVIVSEILGFGNSFQIAGAIVLLIGVVLMWLDK